MKFRLIMMYVLLHTAATSAYHIFWDLGNVLITIDKMSMTYDLGPMNMLRYTAQGNSPTQIPHLTQQILGMLGEQKPSAKRPLATAGGDIKSGGIPMSQIMCDLLCGTISSEKFLKAVTKKIDELDEKNFFSSDLEKDLVLSLIDLMYEPKNIAKYRKQMSEGVELLKKCQRNKQHTNYVMSNWDPDSFGSVRKAAHLKSLFNLFDEKQIVLSCNLGTIKPYHDFFGKIVSTYRLKPSECILIDDSADNIAAAQAMGWIGIHVPDKNFSKALEKLTKLGIL